MSNYGLGRTGEDRALLFLKKRGFNILERNFRAGKTGEIDIIALKGELLVFAEVKTRTSDSKGNPSETITYYKKKSIFHTALAYLSKHPEYTEYNIRFDLIAIIGDDIECIENIILEDEIR